MVKSAIIPSSNRQLSSIGLRRPNTKHNAKGKTSTTAPQPASHHGSTPASQTKNAKITKTDMIDKTLKDIDVHGWRSLFRASSTPSRIFWLLVSLLCLALLIYELIVLFDNYLTRPLSTSYEIVANKSMYFPSFRVCPLNTLNWTLLGQHENKPLLRYAYQITQNTGVIDYRGHHTASTRATNFTLMESYEKFMKFSYQLDEFMPSCGFTHAFSGHLNCSDIATPWFHSVFGMCFAISLENRTQNIPGRGLALTFNIGKKHFPTLHPFAPLRDGVDITFGDERNYLAPGAHYNLEIRAESLKFINLERGNVHHHCVGEGKHSFDYQIINRDYNNYSQVDCIRDCYNRELWNICNCVPIMDPSEVKPQLLNDPERPLYLCDANRSTTCVRPLIDDSAEIRNRVEECKSRCHIPCQFTRYQMKVTFAKLNPLGYQILLNESNSTMDNFITVTLAYPALDYTEIQQDVSKNFDELVSDIGGQIGLWMGASMVTIIQIPFVLSTLCVLLSVRKAGAAKEVAVKYARKLTPQP